MASDASGLKLLSVGQSNTVYVSLDGGAIWFSRPVLAQPSSAWFGAASSTTGGRLYIVAPGWAVRSSIDSGLNWTALPTATPSWSAVACSSDGSKVVATTNGGGIYTATNFGATAGDWTLHNGAGAGLGDTTAAWNSVASSSDGVNLVATVSGGRIYTSSDSGANWVARDQNRLWTKLASSADGRYLAATVYGGQVYTSNNYGANWSARATNRDWQCIASSADGSKLVAGVFGGQIHTSQQYLTGAQGSTAELQYIGNGQWQPLNQSLIAPGVVGSAQLAPDLDIAGTVSAARFVSTAAGAEPPSGVTPILGMVWIKPGTFVMGSPSTEAGRLSDEGPQTVVTLTKGFWMGHHEVTQGEYVKVIGSNPSYFTGDLNRPVEQVNWTQATTYCTALTTGERTAGRLPAGWGYRLPTEAEWEYACRGYSTTRFSYGDDLSATALGNYAWYSSNSGNAPHPVAQKLANPWGLMDMHGNVYEWCQDWYGATYPGGSVTDPQGAGTGSVRVVRGGSWFDLAGYCRSALRFNDPALRRDFGFRVVLSPGQP